MWQDITVCIIGIFVALYVGRQIYRLIKRSVYLSLSM